jgi:D-alanyl-D-alanine carboxypeptidase
MFPPSRYPLSGGVYAKIVGDYLQITKYALLWHMRFFCLFLLLLPLLSCFSSGKDDAGPKANSRNNFEVETVSSVNEFAILLSAVMRNAELPVTLSEKIQVAANRDYAFTDDLLACLAEDRHLRELVDKQHSLPPGYVPSDLVSLSGTSYRLNRAGLTLCKVAADSLEEMAAAARSSGITLIVSSTYRSFNYQEEVYNRIVREMGREAADRESARPGHSQHQTGLVADFGSIDDSFALTDAGRWMAANAPRFGWSLSFPDGYEAVTGYRWESWHYRYVGKKLASFIDSYFDGIQQYALRFLHEYEQTTVSP